MVGFIITFFMALILAPFFIKIAKKLKFGQNILGYVSEHASKQGTPTMGGLIFILPTIIVSLFFIKGNYQIPALVLAVFLGYSLVGFLDDFIKIKFKRNLGLHAYQKIIFQILIAVIVALFVFKNPNFSTKVIIPFTNLRFELGWFFIPYIIIVFLATTNSVNLTDGLDGLAGSTSLVFFVAVTFINVIYTNYFSSLFPQEYLLQMQNLNTICLCISGGLLAFLVFNFHPAKIFMGDTGSLALGGLMSIVCTLNGLTLFIPIIGFMFVISATSVIIQVLHFKRTKRRIFLMAPFHHHLQLKGLSEAKISFYYSMITCIIGALLVISYL